MHLAWWVIVLGVALVAVAVVFAVRRRRLLLLRGAMEMSVHRSGLFGGWVLGIASYAGDELRWYRMTSLRAGPSMRIDRRDTQIDGPGSTPSEHHTWMPPNPRILLLQTSHGDHEVAVSESALAGLLSWWEAAGPSWRP